ncbi:MAG: GNAT family N-acetyltransferase [Smithellaceae bacterium]|nr:GNAT family N-acetyltransferase [Smithellaceae bacterium]
MSYVRVIEDTFFAVCRHWGGLQNTFDVFGPVRAMQTGIASADLNMAWSESPLTQGDAPWVRQVEKYYETASLPYWWWVFPRAKTAETIRLLKDTGHVHLLNMPCLLADLGALPLQEPAATVRRVENQEDLALWQEVTFAGFDFSQGDRTSYDRFAGAFSLGPDSPQKAFLAFDGYRPVAASLLFLAGNAAGLYFITTLGEYRRRGIGRELVLTTLHHARAAGARYASLQSSPDGLTVYEQAGFKECCRVDIYGRKG